MHISAFKMSGKIWYCVVFDGGTSDTFYGSFAEAEKEFKRLKKLKAERLEKERLEAEEYDEELDTPLPQGFVIFTRIRGGVLYALLVGPSGFLRVFVGPNAVARAKARAWRSLEPNQDVSNDHEY